MLSVNSILKKSTFLSFLIIFKGSLDLKLKETNNLTLGLIKNI